MIYPCFTLRDGVPTRGIQTRMIQVPNRNAPPMLARARSIQAITPVHGDMPYRKVRGLLPPDGLLKLATIENEHFELNAVPDGAVARDDISAGAALIYVERSCRGPIIVGDQFGWTISHATHEPIPYRKSIPGEFIMAGENEYFFLARSYEPFVTFNKEGQAIRCCYSGGRREMDSMLGESAEVSGIKPCFTMQKFHRFIEEELVVSATPGLTVIKNAGKLQVLC